MENLVMQWAVAIGSFIGAAVSAALIGWKVYQKVFAPALKKLGPAVEEITGGDDDNVPGLRQLVENTGAHAKAASLNATAAVEGQNILRRDFRDLRTELVQRMDAADTSVATEFGRVNGRLDEHARELTELKNQAKSTIERLTTVETIQRQRKEDKAANGAGAATEAGPATDAGADRRESPQPPPQPPSVEEARS